VQSVILELQEHKIVAVCLTNLVSFSSELLTSCKNKLLMTFESAFKQNASHNRLSCLGQARVPSKPFYKESPFKMYNISGTYPLSHPMMPLTVLKVPFRRESLEPPEVLLPHLVVRTFPCQTMLTS
jgi:hypothetical protein